jgi:hypothetical protein
MNAGSGSYRVVGGSVSLIHTRLGLQSSAQADDQGRITLTATGPSPRNEEDVLDICTRVVRMLILAGGDWTVPVTGDQDIDGYSRNSTGDQLWM